MEQWKLTVSLCFIMCSAAYCKFSHESAPLGCSPPTRHFEFVASFAGIHTNILHALPAANKAFSLRIVCPNWHSHLTSLLRSALRN